jgi:hypothetical protein
MSDLQLILYDDAHARDWFPFTLTRPAGELLFGAHLQREPRTWLASTSPTRLA